MFDYFAKRILEMYSQPFDMINSPFAFPRLPPRSNAPLGISAAGRIKDTIVHDNNTMIGKLFDHHQMFQRYAAGLFDLSRGEFSPGHPMHMKTHSVDKLQEENDILRTENASFKTEHNKEKKK